MARITMSADGLNTEPLVSNASVSVAPTIKIEQPTVIEEHIKLEQVIVENEFDPSYLQEQIDDLKRLAGMPTEVIKERVIEHKLDTSYADLKIQEIEKKLLTKNDVRVMMEDHKEKLQILHEQLFTLKTNALKEKEKNTKIMYVISALIAIQFLILLIGG